MDWQNDGAVPPDEEGLRDGYPGEPGEGDGDFMSLDGDGEDAAPQEPKRSAQAELTSMTMKASNMGTWLRHIGIEPDSQLFQQLARASFCSYLPAAPYDPPADVEGTRHAAKVLSENMSQLSLELQKALSDAIKPHLPPPVVEPDHIKMGKMAQEVAACKGRCDSILAEKQQAAEERVKAEEQWQLMLTGFEKQASSLQQRLDTAQRELDEVEQRSVALEASIREELNAKVAPAPAPAPAPSETTMLLQAIVALIDLIPPEVMQGIPPQLSEFLNKQTAPPAADNAVQEESKGADGRDDPIGPATQRERDLSPHQPARGKLRQLPKAQQTAEEATAARAAAAQLAKKTEAAMRLEETRAKLASDAGSELPFEGPEEAPIDA